jgi:GWxTD domain-containing protein
MKRLTVRSLSTLFVSAVLALPGLAAIEKLKDWDKSPEYSYLATDDEKKEWKKVATDGDAEKFVALFWARRDPDIKTPQNEFRERFDELVKKADELFPLGKKRGALTERGKAFILLGAPKTMAQGPASSLTGGPGTPSPNGIGSQGPLSGTGPLGDGGAATILTGFKYEKPQLPPWADIQSLELRFQVEVGMSVEHFAAGMSDAKRLETKAAQVALVNPQLKEVPVYKTKEQFAAEQKAAADKLAEESKGPALSESARATLEGLGKEPFGPLTLLPLAYRDGATRLMAQLYAPAAAAGTGEGLKLLILGRDKDGKDVVRLEEPAKLQNTKADFFADRTFRVVPGDYDVAAALVDGSGKVVVSSRRPVVVPPLSTDFAASVLLIAVNDFPADSPKPDDPFTFSARQFVVKGDGRLDPTDGLSYAVRLYNPPVDPLTHSVALKRSVKIKPKGQPAIEVPSPPEDPAKVPDQKDAGALILDLAGSVVESNLGQYFRPGDYELRVTITDVTTGKKLDLVAPFTVTGSLPAAPPAPAPPPKKKS